MIVVASDFHPDANTAGFPRFDDVRSAAMESVDYAIKHGAEAYVFCGDLITNDPSLDLMIRCAGLLLEMDTALECGGVARYKIPGNHDVFEDGRCTTVLDFLDPIKQPTYYPEERLGFLPFSPSSHSYDPEYAVYSWKEYDTKPRAIFGHLNVEGITPGSELSDFPRGRDVFFPVDACKRLFPDAILVNGHIHRRQVFNGVHIVGSLVNLTRGEVDNEPGFLVLDV